MRRKTASALADALLAARRIKEALQGRTLEEFEQNWMLASAVERQFLIAGEALTWIRDDEPPIYERIGDRVAAIAFRNRIVHGYDSLDPARVFAAAGAPLASLLSTLEALVAEAEAEGL